MPVYNIALVDDHSLLRNGLASLITSFGDFNILFEADNGKDMQQKIMAGNLPDLVLLDINMPEMDGHESASWLLANHPEVRVLALSMYDDEQSIIKMLRAGARGYILKDSDPAELRNALEAVAQKGFYYSELVTGRLVHVIQRLDVENNDVRPFTSLNEREVEFLKLACTEMTYKEIADKMYLSPRTIDGYRDALFEKLKLKTRVGLVIYAIRNGIVKL